MIEKLPNQLAYIYKSVTNIYIHKRNRSVERDAFNICKYRRNKYYKKIGGNPEIRKHLENLGFVMGENVTVINSIGGNVIVNIKDSRVAVSAEMAKK